MFLNLVEVSKQYDSIKGQQVLALDNITLNINKYEFVGIIGESGSGKTTLIEIIANLNKPTSGVLSFNKDKPKIGIVFQDNSILPWKTVQGNLKLAYKSLSSNEKGESENDFFDEMLDVVGLPSNIYKNKYSKELSGGEKRRVAIACSLIHDPTLLLLDEPTSQLDVQSKRKIQETLQDLWLKKKFTCVFVTHDIEEAVFLSDRIIKLDKGEIVDNIEDKLPRPRTNEMRLTVEFQSYLSKIGEID